MKNPTNLKLLRYYLEHYIEHDKRVRYEENYLYIIRQLEPTDKGLPLQLYFFVREIKWREYERVQSDIMDEVYALVQDFGLVMFQSPSGRDFAK